MKVSHVPSSGYSHCSLCRPSFLCTTEKTFGIGAGELTNGPSKLKP